MEINLISDTVTRPTPDMLKAMFQAKVGDDVFKQDPTVNALEEKVADFFGKKAALFFPSGTMANQTAIKIHTQPGEQLIADHHAHIYNYEGGGVSFNSGVSCRLLVGDRGRLNASQVEAAINPPDFYHSPLTTLVSLENTCNRAGGSCYEMEDLIAIERVCRKHKLSYHLDGARLWNALIHKNQDPKQYGQLFDTISVCFSKGMGTPIGSVLVMDAEHYTKALRIRKVFGGGMRQVGYLAAAAIYSMDHHLERLAEDHRRAREIGALLNNTPWIERVEEVETNIVIFAIKPHLNEELFIQKLQQKHIFISSLGKGKMRMVTHLDYKEVMHTYVLETLEKLAM